MYPDMYLALTLLLMLAFTALCLVGLFTLIRQAIAGPAFTAPGVFMEDLSPAGAAPRSKDAEGGACGEGRA
jgi:hypothetical protein